MLRYEIIITSIQSRDTNAIIITFEIHAKQTQSDSSSSDRDNICRLVEGANLGSKVNVTSKETSNGKTEQNKVIEVLVESEVI